MFAPPGPPSPFSNHATLGDDLISYWKLNEASGDRDDVHGGNDLADVNSVGAASSSVIGGAAYFLNTSSQYLTKEGPGIILDLSLGMTVSFWAYKETGCPDNAMRFQWGQNSSTATLSFSTSVAVPNRWNITDNDGLSRVNLGTSTLDTWEYFVLGYDPITKKAMGSMNGQALFNSAGPTLTNHPILEVGKDQFRLGASILSGGGAASAYYRGNMDETGLWNRMLTDPEVTALWNGGAGLAY